MKVFILILLFFLNLYFSPIAMSSNAQLIDKKDFDISKVYSLDFTQKLLANYTSFINEDVLENTLIGKATDNSTELVKTFNNMYVFCKYAVYNEANESISRLRDSGSVHVYKSPNDISKHARDIVVSVNDNDITINAKVLENAFSLFPYEAYLDSKPFTEIFLNLYGLQKRITFAEFSNGNSKFLPLFFDEKSYLYFSTNIDFPLENSNKSKRENVIGVCERLNFSII